MLTLMLISKLLSGKAKPQFKGFKGVVEIKHAIPGRIRFFIPILKNNPEGCDKLQKQLVKADVIREIKINPVIGSLLMIYDKDGTDEATLTGVVAKLLGLEDQIDQSPLSSIGKEIKQVMKSLNTSVYEYSNGVVDLNNLITLGFFSLGAYSLLRNPRTLPSGLSLLYWAYNNAQKQ
jgi:hypothetical protein